MHEGGKAEEEFQKIVDHRGSDAFDYAFANLGQARAYALQKDAAKAGPSTRISSPVERRRTSTSQF